MNNNQYEMSGSEAEIWSQIGGLKEAVRENRRQQCALSESDGEIRAQIAELSAAYLEMQQQRPAPTGEQRPVPTGEQRPVPTGEVARKYDDSDISKAFVFGAVTTGIIATLLYWANSGTEDK